MMKNIVILGSTGSIGTQTLGTVRYNQDVRVTALVAGGNVCLMERQIRESKPRLACLWDENKAMELRARVFDPGAKVVSGMNGLIEAATESHAETVATGVVGTIGTKPTIAAMEAGRDIALANKETLATAGYIIMPLAGEKGAKILPVDSEYSAIFQRLRGEGQSATHKVLLTASGGPLRGWTREQMASVRVKGAFKHPNWSMGHKITIDSATLVNKGLEVMETHWLFHVSTDHARVVVQPASITHSMVEYEDGTVIAQIGTSGMELPIQYAIYYPKRRYLLGDRLDFTELTQISFEVSDMESFHGLKLAYETGGQGGSMLTVLNVVNEMVVAMFLRYEIGSLTIVDMIGEVMVHHKIQKNPDAAGILEAEQEAYEFIKSRFNSQRVDLIHKERILGCGIKMKQKGQMDR